MKNYKVLLSDTQYYWVEVEAEDEAEAEAKITKTLQDGDDVDTYEAGEQDYTGYDVQEGRAKLVG